MKISERRIKDILHDAGCQRSGQRLGFKTYASSGFAIYSLLSTNEWEIQADWPQCHKQDESSKCSAALTAAGIRHRIDDRFRIYVPKEVVQ
jgi:hypothetical protein